MVSPLPARSESPAASVRKKPAFSEAGAWGTVGDGWRHLHGGLREYGYSIEWHDFQAERDLDWSRSFHPGGLEICLNLAGCGEVRAGNHRLALAPSTAGFYAQSDRRLAGVRRGGQWHRFITVEMSLEFLRERAPGPAKGLHPSLAGWIREKAGTPFAAVSEPVRLSSEQQQVVGSLRQPPVYAAAQPMWYEAKALEIAATLLYQPLPGEEFFCQRVKRLNRERVQKVIAILKQNLAEPPGLEEIGRRVGCSHFYLSRIFSEQMGRSIFQHLRELRLERAAALLCEGKMQITQIALEVGYASPSHFTSAFRETFGCCPGLYPLQTPTQRTR